MERAENLARLLDVNETFARDDQGEANWLPILEINSDEKRFFSRQKRATASAVIRFYVCDRENPTSIVSDFVSARENARSLRHLISTEMWLQLNVFGQHVQRLRPRDLKLAELSRICARIKEGCQAHAGIVEGTFYRDQAWCFYQLGKEIERTDQISRLIDISARHAARAADAEGSAAQVSRWNALLRSAAGYQAFRRTNSRGMRPTDVIDFLVSDRGFPRSMATAISQMRVMFALLSRRHRLERSTRVESALVALDEASRGAHSFGPDTRVISKFVDEVQVRLIQLTNALGDAYFHAGREETPPAPRLSRHR